MSTNNLLNTGVVPLYVSQGGTGHNAVVTSPTATSWAGWDANENLSANNFLYNSQTHNTDTGTLVITVSSPYYTILTGNTSRYLFLPDNTTIPLGYSVRIFNDSSVYHILAASNNSDVYTLLPGFTVIATSINTSVSTASSWNVVVESEQNTVPGLQNQLAYYASNGIEISGLVTAANSLLVTDSAGAPRLGTAILSDITINGITAGKGNGDGVSTTVFGASAGPGVGYTATGYVSIGFQSAALATSNNGAGSFIAIGAYAGLHANDYDIFIGSQTAQESSGGSNIGIGYQALYRGGSSLNACLAFGSATLSSLTSGQNVTAVGPQCAQDITACSYGIFIGSYASATDPSNCNNVIAIGSGAIANSPTGTNGAGIAFGGVNYRVGYNSNGLPYANNSGNTAGYWRVTVNGTNFLMPLMQDGVLTPSSCFLTDGNGTPTLSSSLTDGQIIIGSTGNAPVPANLTAGDNITITNTSGNVTISGTTAGIQWIGVSSTLQAALPNHGYIIQNSSATTIALPATADLGSTVNVQGLGAGGWSLAANTGQTIQFGTSRTTTAGALTSTNQWDACQVVCVVADTTWSISYSTTNALNVT